MQGKSAVQLFVDCVEQIKYKHCAGCQLLAVSVRFICCTVGTVNLVEPSVRCSSVQSYDQATEEYVSGKGDRTDRTKMTVGCHMVLERWSKVIATLLHEGQVIHMCC
jgi:hypothetical protein